MSWRALLNSPPADSRVVYDVGGPEGLLSEGRVVLTLSQAGRFSLEQMVEALPTVWDGTLSDTTFDALMAVLADTEFPAAPERDKRIEGEPPRELRVEAGKNTASVALRMDVADGGWKRVFAILDAIVSQASEGELRSFQSKVRGLVIATARRPD